MPRTSEGAVRDLLDSDASIPMYPHIEAANLIVTNVCAVLNSNPPDNDPDPLDSLAPPPSPAYSDSQLELIERWLAAHFYAVRDPRLKNEKAGDVGATYQVGSDGMMFESTQYGQQALMLDTQGALAAYQRRLKDGVPPRPGITHLGRKRRGDLGFYGRDWPY